MTKRIIALLLALILTVGLLPTVALAADGDPTTDTKTSGVDSKGNKDNPVHIVKSATTDAYGNGTLKLEAYVTDPMEIVTEDVPLDIVLVLDQSGSMGFCINCGEKTGEYKGEKWKNESENCPSTKTYEFVGKAKSLTSGEYYAYKEQKPKKVTYCDGNDSVWPHQAGWYWADKSHSSWNRLGDNADLYKQVTKTSKHVHRLDTLKTVLTSFTNSVKTRAANADVAHRIAMVGFASSGYNNTEILTGVDRQTDEVMTLYDGNRSFDSNATAYYYPQETNTSGQYKDINGVQKKDAKQANYKNALVDVSKNPGKTSVTNAINALTAQGGTQTDDGLEMAAKIFENNPLTDNDKGRKRIVILFTDGDSDAGEDAKEQASALKNTYNATVYTVGLFAGADQTKTNGNNGFLQNVSSNNGKAPREGEKSYYLAANDAISLQKVFEQITEEVNKLMLDVGTKSVLSDTLSDQFDFNISSVDGDLSSKVKFTLVPVDSKNDDGTFTWNEVGAQTITTPKLTKGEGKSFTVTGFDYGANKITRVYNNDGEITGYTGNKLVIEIPIKADTTKTTGWTAGKTDYPTNSSTDGAKLSYKDEKGNGRSTTVESPKAPVTGYTVTYDYGTGSEKPAGVSMPTHTRAYIDGQTIEVMPASTAPDGYTFDGWYTDAACTPTNKVDAANPPAINKANRTLYGKFTKSAFDVNLSTYFKKHLTLTGVTELPNAENFTITGAEYVMNGGTKELTGVSFTGETGAIKSTPVEGTAFTGDGMTIRLSVGTHYFTVTEAAGTTTSMKYAEPKDITITVAANAEGTGAVVTVSDGTITNTYAPTSGDGFTLNGKFQKTLVSNVELSKLPDAAKSFELKIWEGTDTTATAKATGTATINSLTKDEQTGKYTGSANFNFGNTVLTFTEAKEYTYTVKETVGTVAGMQYDTNTYTLTITVVNNNGKFEVQSATIGSTDMKNRGPLTITNTFTAAELPLDPPDGPGDPEKPTLGAKVIKSLTGDTKTETFQAQLLEGTTVKATASAVATTDAPAAFKGFGTLVFTAADTYTFTIKETVPADADKVPGMTYDETTHTMVVTVTATDNKLVVSSVTIDGTSVSLDATTPWVTINNKYTTPKDAQVTKKEVVVTQPTDPLKTAVDAFEHDNSLTVLYPTGDGVTSNTLEVPYGTTAATLLYKITVYAGTQSDYTFEDKAASFVYAENAKTVTKNGDYFTVTFENGEEYAYVYVAVTHGLNFDDDICEVDNTVLGQTAKTTVKEKDPNSVTVDFSRYVYKKLTVTGSKAFTGATFEAVLDGEWHDLPAARSLEDASAIATYAHATPGAAQLHKTLTVSFDANDDLTQNKAFTGSITFNAEGVYTYTLKEVIPEGATGYDTSEFHFVVTVEANGNGQLEATVLMWFNDELMPLETGILFSNTIDTGRDDYIPIIIPTIINKDTGMLNKTDHFAYVIGYPDGTVHPNGQITRAEVATIFFRLLRDEVRDGAFTTSNSYSDVAYGKWYNNPISTMSALGIITGYPDGTFKPNKPITRAEFAAIAARFDETQSGKSATFSDVIGHWAAKEIGIAYYNDWIKGYPDGTFKPDQNITRAEAMTLINRVLERKPESPADLLTNMNKWTDNMDTSKWYYLDVQEATNSHGYTRKTFNYELWRQMLPDPDWSRYER